MRTIAMRNSMARWFNDGRRQWSPGQCQRRMGSGARGQALIEFTMFVLFMSLFLAGLTDVGGLLDVHIAAVYAARQGARTGSVVGNAGDADCAIVGAVHSALLNQPNLTLSRIVIYQATTTPNGRYTGTQNAEIYPGTADCSADQIVISGTSTQITPTTSGSGWQSTSRSISPFTEDSLGVELDYTYQLQFNLLGAGPFSVTDYSVCPLNPVGVPTVGPTATPTP